MTFKLVVLAALLAIARAGYINGGHAVGPSIGGSYVSNGGLLRTGSQSYSSGYGYPVGSSGRTFSSGLSGSVIVRPGYGSPYPYGGRSLTVGVPSYQSVSGGYGARSLSSYPTSSYPYSSPQILRSELRSQNTVGFNGGYNGAYNNGYGSSNLQNFAHQPIAYTVSPLQHNLHGSYNGLATGYGY